MKYLERYKVIDPLEINVGDTYGKRPGLVVGEKFFDKIPYIINYLKKNKISYGMFTNDVYFFIIIYVDNDINLLPYDYKNMEHYFPLSDDSDEDDNIVSRLKINWFENRFFNGGKKLEWKEFITKTPDDMEELKEYIDDILIKKSADKFNL